MKLVFPNITYKQQAIDFIAEFNQANSEINGTGSLPRYLLNYSFDEWLKKVGSDIDFANVPEERFPAITYFCVKSYSNQLIGMMNIRFGSNGGLERQYGHVGYCVRPSERNNHYLDEKSKKIEQRYLILV